jgi:hypothetical protein
MADTTTKVTMMSIALEATPITIQMIGKVGHAYRQAAISVH